MNRNINLGKIDENGFKESKSATLARLIIEENNRIKTHFLEMDRTPNFDGKLMILEGQFERITVEVQIKTLTKKKINSNGEFLFDCDTKAMNSVTEKVTFNPVVLIVVDIKERKVYYKLLTKEYVSDLNIGNKKTKRIYLSSEDEFVEDKFIKEICQEVKITKTDVDCIIECGLIREIIEKSNNITKEKYKLVYIRDKVKGYFTSYKFIYGDNNEKSLPIGNIKMIFNNVEEILSFQYDRDYIHINRQPSDLLDVTDADIANIILEVSKYVKKPILYTNSGKPTFWFDERFMWQLRAEEINLDWYYGY
ncbi:DUF4365 domain-containing protein [Clostridium butyricum]|uniref:DUF4365 domain-containing protein n=1 Tax=Clostridium butyricum TaxID=1492 RepID=UPI001CA80334|nr:DUF4365 domain-containing protein [Clostridium butyricum]MBZ0312752.1 DUF4365 domain-containing protein [Clostridium butyricum]